MLIASNVNSLSNFCKKISHIQDFALTVTMLINRQKLGTNSLESEIINSFKLPSGRKWDSFQFPQNLLQAIGINDDILEWVTSSEI